MPSHTESSSISEQTADLDDKDAPSRRGIYRGWQIVGVSALSIGVVLGTVQFTFGLFITPLEEEFGWSRTQVNVALTIGVVSGLLSPLIGGLLDRFGSRWTMAVSIALVAIAFFLRSIMTELWQFYLFSAVMFAGTPGATMMPAGKLVMTWFPRTRGRMMGRVTAGNNIGSGIAVPIVAGLIALVGWRWTFGVMGIALLGLMLLVILIIRDASEDVEKEQAKQWAPGETTTQKPLNIRDGLAVSEAVGTSAFWLLIIGMTLQQFVRTGVVSQMVPHLEQVGFSRSAATGALILLAACGASSKLIFGWLSETITARLAFIAIMVLQGVGLAILVMSGGSFVTWGAIVIFGLGMGGVGALTPLVLTEMFGLKQFGSIMGLSRMAIIIPVFLGPIMAGLIFDSRGDYNLMFLITIGFLAVSIVSFMLIKTPRWKSGGNT